MRWYYFIAVRSGVNGDLYIGKCETTEAAIRRQFRCSIDGNTVYIYSVL
jgi:hypothetical protein